jgi:hypothetical protein
VCVRACDFLSFVCALRVQHKLKETRRNKKYQYLCYLQVRKQLLPKHYSYCLGSEMFNEMQGKDNVRGCIQKFPDWPPRARTANGTVVSLFRESV